MQTKCSVSFLCIWQEKRNQRLTLLLFSLLPEGRHYRQFFSERFLQNAIPRSVGNRAGGKRGTGDSLYLLFLRFLKDVTIANFSVSVLRPLVWEPGRPEERNQRLALFPLSSLSEGRHYRQRFSQ